MSTGAGIRLPSRTWLVEFGSRWGTFVVAVLIWQIVTDRIDNRFAPPPLEIGADLVERWLSSSPSTLFLSDLAIDNLLPSLGRMLLAWLISATVGIVLGIALGRSRTAMDYVGPLLAFARALPPPVLVPVFLLIFSLGTPMQLATIVFGTVWPVLLNTADGARSIDPTQTATARSFRIPRVQWVLGVVLPAASPKIFAGLRISLSLALILMVVSELVGAFNGIGNQLNILRDTFQYTGMWSVIVLLGVLGYVLNSLLLAVENRALRWLPSTADRTKGRRT